MNNKRPRITRSRARCGNCENIIESKHRHDFVVCVCWVKTGGDRGIFLDGGNDYVRSGGHDIGDAGYCTEYEGDTEKPVFRKPDWRV